MYNNMAKRVVIVDLDGTLVIPIRAVLCAIYALGRADKFWYCFAVRCMFEQLDLPNPELMSYLRRAARNDDVVLVLLTGRLISARSRTLRWLKRWKIPYTLLLMKDYARFDYEPRFKIRMLVRKLLGLLREAVVLEIHDDNKQCVYAMSSLALVLARAAKLRHLVLKCYRGFRLGLFLRVASVLVPTLRRVIPMVE